MFASKFVLLLLTGFFVLQTEQFRIPLPFGSIDLNKNPDGTVDFAGNSNINILGYGANSGLNFTSRNGSFAVSPALGAIVKNQTYGSSSSLAVDQNKGVGIDSNVNLGEKTLHGGLGKEAQFINEAVQAGQEAQQQNRPIMQH
ncbi:hypothetical protein M3Y97_01019400 [Aphelenchoides bicaudatus]|nr:hypothetical protein M3Y97_01019400 [Aphelenchoides bicaudatus]